MRRVTTTNQPRLALERLHTNRNLFADNFLEHRLDELPEWRSADGLDEVFVAILQLYNERASRFSDATNEAQTEDDFIKPVLRILWGEIQPGDCYQVQVSIPNLDTRARQPDYAFFRVARDRDAAESLKTTLEYWREVPCLGDAKA